MKSLLFRLMLLLSMAAVLLTGCSPEGPQIEKILPAVIEEIEGSEFKRVVLTAKAAERITVQTAPVFEMAIEPRIKVGGEVVVARSLGETTAQSSNSFIRVTLAKSGSQDVDAKGAAFIIPITGSSDIKPLSARSVDLVGVVDDGEEDDDLEDIYLELDDDDFEFSEGERVFVDLPLAVGQVQRKVVPYSAVLYGVNGETWVYVNLEPLVFVRQRITIDFIDGDQVFLIEGPAVDVPVVTMGVAELFGAETGVSK